MNLNDKSLLISEIAKRCPNIGKTAMMKCLYLLQTVEKVPANYLFEIYTYGPYSSEIMEEIDDARQKGLVSVSGVKYPNGKFGYSITCTEEAKKILTSSHTIDNYQGAIARITDEFGDRTAKDLELITTIIYINCSYSQNRWNTDAANICEAVHEIKPYFTIDTILHEYNILKVKGHLEQALA